MLVAVDDHSELGPPVANVVVGDDFVPDKTERAGQGVADNRRADMANVHRLGHVGRGIVDDVGLGSIDRRDAESSVADGQI